MKFKQHELVRDIEDSSKWEIVELEYSLKDLMAKDTEAIFDFSFSFVIIWFTICLMFASLLGFIYVIRTYF